MKHLQTAYSEHFLCNKVLPYTCSMEFWKKKLIKKTYFIKTYSFHVLERSFQYNDKLSVLSIVTRSFCHKIIIIHTKNVC